ncbi:glutamine synthetase [Ruminococcaceae bacterium YRB3002]|nr:glutamine synthetase [Ruminococcaceae bacterium YRB3002]
MNCSLDEFMQYIEEEDIKFIKLAFCDVHGVPKNISIMPNELEDAVMNGIPINASLIPGFGEAIYSDIYLHPDITTTTLLPWRPENGKVVRIFCDITLQDGTPFAIDTRKVLIDAVRKADDQGIEFLFGSRIEFYLFKTDEDGNPTNIPYDNAGYMDIAPLDKGENVRRDICLCLERMGILPINSHHEAGPGQNQIDFGSSDPVKAADNVITYMSAVKTIAARYGLYADFSPKPIGNAPGNGFHINVLAKRRGSSDDVLTNAIAGILDHIHDTTFFFNNSEQSYKRFGQGSAPSKISWSGENRGQLIRIHRALATGKDYAQLRSPDALANPYLAMAMIIHECLDGIANKTELPAAGTTRADLPSTLEEAKSLALADGFAAGVLGKELVEAYCR